VVIRGGGGGGTDHAWLADLLCLLFGKGVYRSSSLPCSLVLPSGAGQVSKAREPCLSHQTYRTRLVRL
jgi:hypothetical protein